MANEETIKIKSLTKYGFKLEDGTMIYATPEVMTYLKDKLPCEVEVTETKPYGNGSKNQLTRVRLVKSSNFTKKPSSPDRPKVDAGNTLSLAVNIHLEKLKEPLSDGFTLHSICEELVKEFKYLEGELK